MMDKVALITGATGDIGTAITKALIKDGFNKVAISSIEADLLRDMEGDLTTPSCEVASFQVNLLDSEQADNLFPKVLEKFGGIHAIVNNAGITKDNLIMRMSDEDWDLVLNINLKACFKICRAAARTMLGQRFGRIVNIASVVGCMGNPGQANYCASKAGLIGLTKALAQEFAPRGVTVNCIAPGFIDSAMTKGLVESVKEKLLSIIPLGRMGTP
jgi:3-oxoacyl-[acyl-carrier protein] reductase